MPLNVREIRQKLDITFLWTKDTGVHDVRILQSVDGATPTEVGIETGTSRTVTLTPADIGKKFDFTFTPRDAAGNPIPASPAETKTVQVTNWRHRTVSAAKAGWHIALFVLACVAVVVCLILGFIEISNLRKAVAEKPASQPPAPASQPATTLIEKLKEYEDGRRKYDEETRALAIGSAVVHSEKVRAGPPVGILPPADVSKGAAGDPGTRPTTKPAGTPADAGKGAAADDKSILFAPSLWSDGKAHVRVLMGDWQDFVLLNEGVTFEELPEDPVAVVKDQTNKPWRSVELRYDVADRLGAGILEINADTVKIPLVDRKFTPPLNHKFHGMLSMIIPESAGSTRPKKWGPQKVYFMFPTEPGKQTPGAQPSPTSAPASAPATPGPGVSVTLPAATTPTPPAPSINVTVEMPKEMTAAIEAQAAALKQLAERQAAGSTPSGPGPFTGKTQKWVDPQTGREHIRTIKDTVPNK